jgi:uncharacterized protein (TIGR02466 family)
MPIDQWFPLVVYYADLEDSTAHRQPMAERIDELYRGSGPRRAGDATAWTGDIHNVERIHADPAFAWITGQVGRHAHIYLRTLGVDMEKIDVFVQRSWPVLSAKDQPVGRHAHHNAHFSAVYYISAPAAGSGGQLRFHNEAKPNELSGGFTGGMTSGYKDDNVSNYPSAYYEPIEGRLMLFPAKQVHSVDAHHSENLRVSLSFDLVIASREDRSPGLYEFLMPPPSHWLRLAREEEESGEAATS